MKFLKPNKLLLTEKSITKKQTNKQRKKRVKGIDWLQDKLVRKLG